jgi:hypothetical protein
MTDDAKQYVNLKKHFAKHDVVHHTYGEYVNLEDPKIHTIPLKGSSPSLNGA